MKRRLNRYSAVELAWIETNATLPRRELHDLFCAVFGRTDVSHANLRALCKRKRWLTGRDGRFEKGQAPLNKGKPMPFNAASAATRFKKGQRPHTWRGAGHESIDRKDGYVWMIVDHPNPYTGAATWRVLKHKWLYEQANGPLPPGQALKCLDGDRTNTDPSNWIAIPRAMLPRLNGRFGRDYDTAPDEMKPAILATAELEHRVREARQKMQEKP